MIVLFFDCLWIALTLIGILLMCYNRFIILGIILFLIGTILQLLVVFHIDDLLDIADKFNKREKNLKQEKSKEK